MALTCENCQSPMPANPGPGRPRKQCTTCSPPRHRAKKPAKPRRPARPTTSPQPAEPLPPPPPAAAAVVIEVMGGDWSAPEHPVVAAARAQLGDRIAATVEGALVLHLAQQLAAGGHTASGVAALSKELATRMAAAMKDAPSAGDALDELMKRRAARGA